MSGTITIQMNDLEIVADVASDLHDNVRAMLEASFPQPLRMACDHTLSTGDYFLARARPPVHPVQLGSQATPLGGKTKLLSQLDAGDILYPGGRDLTFAYGPDITEPLMARGPVVARVRPAMLKRFFEMGRTVWNAQVRTHQLVTITASWKG
jgi:hypothetical protein